MSERRSLRQPITLGVVMILLLITLTVLWVLLAVFGALSSLMAPLYWTFLPLGVALLVFVALGVVMYLSLSVKAINLTRRQSNFVDSVTHELKSPIASLKLYLQTLVRHKVSPEQQESFCRFMLDDLDRLDQLINHLLDAARLERQDVEREIEDVYMAELLTNCASMTCLRYRLPAHTIGLDLEPCIVWAAQGELETIFRNLMENAVKYAGPEPQVEVTLRATDGGRVLASVTDNGPGIPRALRRKIFGRFVRLGSELERQKPGTGLGLYIVRTLVSRLKGRVRVGDAKSGQGTTFEVDLPGIAIPTDDSAPDSQPMKTPPQAEVA